MENPAESEAAEIRQSLRSAQSMLPVVYDELRRAAGRLLSGERPGHTLQPTALVHEAYARLANGKQFENELHFFNTAALAMRRILIDYAAARKASKRGGGGRRVDLDDANIPPDDAGSPLDWLALDEALAGLEKVSPRRAQIVMLRYFAGLNDADVSKLLKIAESTIRREWGTARLWLYEHMSRAERPDRE